MAIEWLAQIIALLGALVALKGETYKDDKFTRTGHLAIALAIGGFSASVY
jgi:hypothetical protein